LKKNLEDLLKEQTKTELVFIWTRFAIFYFDTKRRNWYNENEDFL